MKNTISFVAGLLSFLGGACLGCIGPRSAFEHDRLSYPTDLNPIEREVIALKGDQLILGPGGGVAATKTHVSLRRTCYRCTFAQVRDQQVRETTPQLQCYELESDSPYVWSVWSAVPLGNFRLFADASSGNHLVWVNASDVFVAEVSRSRDRCVTLMELLRRSPTSAAVRLPVGELLPDSRSWGVNALYSDIDVVGVSKDDKGNLTVQIRGPGRSEVITLVSEAGGWKVR